MNTSQPRLFSPLCLSIYRALLNHGVLTANETAALAQVPVQSVYRAIKTLIRLGLVKTIVGRPKRYAAISPDEAMSLYLMVHRQMFLESFPGTYRATGGPKNEKWGILISFIQNREEYLRLFTEDLKNASRDVNLIVSGHEVFDETILQYKEAIKRGVVIRKLVQRHETLDKEMFLNWKKLGIEIRFCELINARIIIIDSKLAFLVSYNPPHKEGCVGVRISYEPIAQLVNELFFQKWKGAERLDNRF